MKSNEQLQKDVQDSIKWEPLLNAAEIGVMAKDGVVTLTGLVDSYAKKLEAEEAAKKVTGVKAIVEKIKVKLEGIGKKTDTEITNDILTAFKWNWEVPDNKVKVKVEDGEVTIDGEVEWNFQREAAKKAVNNVTGVKNVINNIKIKSEVRAAIEQKDIEHALSRNWAVDDEDIRVRVKGHSVTLDGIVHSYYQKEEAARIAWNAPGVWNVDNELVVEYD